MPPVRSLQSSRSTTAARGDGGIATTVSGGAAGPCVADDQTLCLNDGRFEVRTSWQTAAGETGTGTKSDLTADTGTFWFFDAANVEVVVKVLDACSFAGAYWVFAAGLTDVGVELTVRDSQSGEVRRYDNSVGTVFQPVTDTAAFSGCPQSSSTGFESSQDERLGAERHDFAGLARGRARGRRLQSGATRHCVSTARASPSTRLGRARVARAARGAPSR